VQHFFLELFRPGLEPQLIYKLGNDSLERSEVISEFVPYLADLASPYFVHSGQPPKNTSYKSSVFRAPPGGGTEIRFRIYPEKISFACASRRG
jgi:hypothetical protein